MAASKSKLNPGRRKEKKTAIFTQKLKACEARLEHSRHELEQFALRAAHDLKQPFNIVSTFLSLLENTYHDKLDPQAREFIQFARTGAQQAHALITELSAFAQANTREAFQPLSSESVVCEAMTRLDPALKECGAKIQCGPLPDIAGGRLQLIRLFENVLSNSIKFRAEQPLKIDISAKKKGALWVFRIADNGIGFDPKYNESVFEMFQQLHKEKYSGPGLGLATCRKIVERHSGTIWAESKVEKGTAIYFSLPGAGPKKTTGGNNGEK